MNTGFSFSCFSHSTTVTGGMQNYIKQPISRQVGVSDLGYGRSDKLRNNIGWLQKRPSLLARLASRLFSSKSIKILFKSFDRLQRVTGTKKVPNTAAASAAKKSQ